MSIDVFLNASNLPKFDLVSDAWCSCTLCLNNRNIEMKKRDGRKKDHRVYTMFLFIFFSFYFFLYEYTVDVEYALITLGPLLV